MTPEAFTVIERESAVEGESALPPAYPFTLAPHATFLNLSIFESNSEAKGPRRLQNGDARIRGRVA